MTARSERWLRIWWRAVLIAGILISVLCVSLVFAAIRNDEAITGHLGTATAQVDAVAFDRTIIHFETPDGVVHSPANGVLYPSGVRAGDLVRIEYDAGNPDLARIAGRSASLTLLPLGTTMLFTWLVAGPLLWWLRRRRRTATPRPAEPALEGRVPVEPS